MLDVKYSIKNLISGIYECQKRIIINRRFIHELESEGRDTTMLINEIHQLEGKLRDFQMELNSMYRYSY